MDTLKCISFRRRRTIAFLEMDINSSPGRNASISCMDAKNAGLYANLFYYNAAAGKLEFICADKIAADGTANLTFTHASAFINNCGDCTVVSNT